MLAKRSALSVAVLAAGLVVTALQQAHAGEAQYKIGDRVAMPAAGDKYLDAVIVAVDPSSGYPYKAHPLGYTSSMDTAFNADMLRVPGTVKMEPVGGIVSDPYLLAAKGQKAFRPAKLYPGAYRCFTRSGGQLVSAATLNFTVLDERRYRDVSGANGTFRFDAASGAAVFQGGSLAGQEAKYEQASNPPVKTQPPQVSLKSGLFCQLSIK